MDSEEYFDFFFCIHLQLQLHLKHYIKRNDLSLLPNSIDPAIGTIGKKKKKNEMFRLNKKKIDVPSYVLYVKISSATTSVLVHYSHTTSTDDNTPSSNLSR